MNYEKLGAFYLGREPGRDEPLLYDAKDLTTHAAIVGMTGSGKTGLGIALLEEALIDNVPVIAIDPKGDITNLALTFPSLSPADFAPWVDPGEAQTKGMSVDELAEAKAALWTRGLAEWGQTGERIARLRKHVDISVYTPGSSAGRPVSALRSFAPPASAVLADRDLLRDRITATTTSLLALAGVSGDPRTSREHLLVANILETTWSENKAIDLAGLIRAIQSPPFDRLGVLNLDMFYPTKARFELALRLNGLLASPSFEAWLDGEPLDVPSLLRTQDGRPRCSIFTIAHLPDSERMFFVSLLLSEILTWTRTCPGTSSLRALIYMDEVFGYFPPVAEPPSKRPLLTLLKQARAFGVGVVLATQNPVDLDYKGLSNCGTWFIGRLQTPRDRERLLDGLESVSGDTDRNTWSETIAGLEKRQFILHNVHDPGPVVFGTRFVMSFLRGPLTRPELQRLTAADTSPGAASLVTGPSVPSAPTPEPSSPPSAEAVSTPTDTSPATDTTLELSGVPPLLDPGVKCFYLTASGGGTSLVYRPALLGMAEVTYTSKTHRVDFTTELTFAAPLVAGPVILDWDTSFDIQLALEDVELEPARGALFVEVPDEAAREAFYKSARKDWLRWVRLEQPLSLFRCSTTKLTSRPGESRRDFEGRVADAARERRDLAAGKLRRKYEKRLRTLQRRVATAERKVGREEAQVRQRELDTAVSWGSAIVGAFVGRKLMSRSNMNSLGRAMKQSTRVGAEQDDVSRARAALHEAQTEVDEVETAFQDDLDALDHDLSAVHEAIEEVTVRAKSAAIQPRLFGLCWLPFRRAPDGLERRDWR